MFILEHNYDDKTSVYIGAPIDNRQFSWLNDRDLFPRPVELTLLAKGTFMRIL